MMELLFATGNERKIREATSVFEPLGIKIKAVEPNIHEIQHSDAREVTQAKARAAYEQLQAPLFVQDTSWEIPALNGFPGAYMKDVTTWFSPEDWLQLMQRHDDKQALCHEHVVYFDGDTLQHFTASFTAKFMPAPRGQGFRSIEQVLAFDDTGRTLAENLDGGHNPQQELGHIIQLATWLGRQ